MLTPFLLRCHDSIWSFLHLVILDIPAPRLLIFPALAGSVWFLTLASLLLTWLARGMPTYPGQSNPHVAFISDIASFELKPLFLVGASMTAVGFWVTVAMVHVLYYEPGFALVKVKRCDGEHEHGLDSSDRIRVDITRTPSSLQEEANNDDDNDRENEGGEEGEDPDTLRTLKMISLLSVFAAGMASTALVLLAVMDTFRYKAMHQFFLRLCFAGLAVQSAGTAIVYAREVLGFVSFVYHWGVWQVHHWSRRRKRVRVFASLSTALILIEVFLGAVFILLTAAEANYQTAGILEWVIAFLGTVYLWLFCGFLDGASFEGYIPRALYVSQEVVFPVQTTGPSRPSVNNTDPERAPLLGQAVNRKYT